MSINMKHFLFLILITIAILAGCSTENPICSENFCVTGEVFPRSELTWNEEFEEISVDEATLINVITATTPAPPVLGDTPTLADIVSHVDAGGRGCIEKTYTFTATVEFNLTSIGGSSITLVTNNDDISFFITNRDDPESLQDYTEGTEYTFTVYIRSVGRYDPDNRKAQSIFSNLATEE